MFLPQRWPLFFITMNIPKYTKELSFLPGWRVQVEVERPWFLKAAVVLTNDYLHIWHGDYDAI